MPNQAEKKLLRAQVRDLRRALSDDAQAEASQQLARRLAGHPRYQRARRLALYWAQDGEIDLGPVISAAWDSGKEVLLPCADAEILRFRPYLERDRLIQDRHGIPVPPPERRSVAVSEIDLLLVPLVAFDRSGQRLGMGGGYYDRLLSQQSTDLPQAVLGVAHSLQELEQVPAEPWDQALPEIITERELIRCRGVSRSPAAE